MSMFEKASRLKIRFPSPKGLLSVEDLWDLPLTSNTGKANLDDIARTLHRELKDEDVSFVTPAAGKDEATQLAFDVVRHVIEVRVAENRAEITARENREKKQRILALIAQKENEALAGQSLDDLKKLAESL